MNKIWTQENIDFLKNFYPEKGAIYCAEKLNRGIPAIYSRCSMLKIRPTLEYLKESRRNRVLKYNDNRPNSDFKVNLDQFLNIEKPEVAYILGYLWADGYIVRNEIRLEILKTDMDTIKSVLLELGDWNFQERVRDNNKPITRAATNNRKLVDFLIDNDYKLKSGTSADKILSKIPNCLKHYFFRGLIDGDGCINKNRLSISSTYTQDWSYVEKITNELSIKSYTYRKINNKNKYSVIEINGINGLVFCEYIYKNINNDNIGLNRKFLKYLELKNHIENGRNYLVGEKKILALEMYNGGIPITQIMKDINIASTTVRRYLKQTPFFEEIQSILKITEEDVLYIRSIYTPSNVREIYKSFSNKISLSGFKKICYGSTWKHLL